MKTRTKSKKVNKAWLHDHVTDPYVRLAQREGYRSRAAYKLKEIDETLRLLRPGQVVVDLGSAPGAWSQYVRRVLGHRAARVPIAQTPHDAAEGAFVGVEEGRGEPGVEINGELLALDVLPMEPVDGVTFIQGDFREDGVLQALCDRLQGRQVDVVLSDMAPNLSGIDSADTARIEHLLELALFFAQTQLQPQGVLVCKVFHGSRYSQWVELFKRTFVQVKPLKPKASRDRSAETFLIGSRLRPEVIRQKQDQGVDLGASRA